MHSNKTSYEQVYHGPRVTFDEIYLLAFVSLGRSGRGISYCDNMAHKAQSIVYSDLMLEIAQNDRILRPLQHPSC